jgi:replicative DNA helicase
MTLPANLDAERAFLSSALQNPSILDVHADHLKAGLFHHPSHKTLFKGLLALWKEGRSVDLITISEWLETNNCMDNCGGPAEVAAIYSHVPTSHNHDEYFNIIRHYHTARLAIAGAERIIDSARNPVINGELSETVQKALVAIASEAESGTRIESIGEAAMRRVDEYETMVKNKGKLMGLTYGFPALDKHTGGMRPGQLIVLGAPTKGGKTALALNIAQRTADAGNPVGIFSLEMSGGELIDRMVSSVTGTDISVLTNSPTKQEMEKIAFGVDQVAKLPIWIRDESSISPLQIMAAARRMVATHNVKMIVFDYIQLAMPTNAKDSRERQVAEVSRCLKLVAKELGITIIALCQLNRNGTARESDAIQHDCDMFFVIRFQEEGDAPEERGYFLDIRLARNCSRASFPLSFEPQYLRFVEREVKQNTN